jgi:hypothetical protein
VQTDAELDGTDAGPRGRSSSDRHPQAAVWFEYSAIKLLSNCPPAGAVKL